MKPKVVQGMEHALNRLNSLPHNYNDTDFALIEEALQILYDNYGVPENEKLVYLQNGSET
jgi:hypothetical protein